MSKVSAFKVAGLDLWFNSNDHRLPHFHAEKPGAWEIVVRFLRERKEMVEVQWSKKKNAPRRAELKSLLDAVEAHREQLLEEWEEKVRVKDPGEET